MNHLHMRGSARGFDMAEIPQKLFFRIGEVCDLIQVQPHVLRYWETEFPTLAPQKNRAGQRVYRRKDVEMVMRIRDLLYVEKFTIAGARKRLIEEAKKGGTPKLKPSGREKVASVEIENETYQNSDVESDLLPEDLEVMTALATPSYHSSTASPAIVTTPQSPATTSLSTQEMKLSPRGQRALRVIKHELEGLLTLLKSDGSLNRSV
jgi:DNA-binding transcriptional MerR regulator